MTGSIRDQFRVPTDGSTPIALARIDPGPIEGMSRGKAEKRSDSDRRRLARLQERLSAEGARSLLLVLQGMDTSGKDGTIKHVIGSMNPQGCRITAFKPPTDQELTHDFLWRIRKALPVPGQVGVFNRSHYEDVLVPRVDRLVPEEVWRTRFRTINSFEKRLVARGNATIVKVFLHISADEQQRRLLKRLDDPAKRWKFHPKDLDHRDLWDDYIESYAEAIGRCSTDVAPWYIVPANAKWFRNWVIGRLLIETLEEMNPRFPEPDIDVDVEAIKARLSGVSSAAR